MKSSLALFAIVCGAWILIGCSDDATRSEGNADAGAQPPTTAKPGTVTDLGDCTSDEECQTASCNPTTKKCRSALNSTCEAATGCAPLRIDDAGGEQPLTCGRYCTGIARSACTGDAECADGVSCDESLSCGL